MAQMEVEEQAGGPVEACSALFRRGPERERVPARSRTSHESPRADASYGARAAAHGWPRRAQPGARSRDRATSLVRAWLPYGNQDGLGVKESVKRGE